MGVMARLWGPEVGGDILYGLALMIDIYFLLPSVIAIPAGSLGAFAPRTSGRKAMMRAALALVPFMALFMALRA